MKKKHPTYAKQIIKIIENAEFANPNTLTFAMLGAKPVNAAAIALRYCNNFFSCYFFIWAWNLYVLTVDIS